MSTSAGGVMTSRGADLIIMQPLHEDDLAGFVLNVEPWEILSFPAIAEHDEAHVIRRFNREYRHLRKAGEALHPARESLETIETIRNAIGEYNFTGQYQ